MTDFTYDYIGWARIEEELVDGSMTPELRLLLDEAIDFTKGRCRVDTIYGQWLSPESYAQLDKAARASYVPTAEDIEEMRNEQ